MARDRVLICKCGQPTRKMSYGCFVCRCGRWYDADKVFKWEHRPRPLPLPGSSPTGRQALASLDEALTGSYPLVRWSHSFDKRQAAR